MRVRKPTNGVLRSLPPERVDDANDIVLAEMGPGLHPYRFELDLAGIADAADFAGRDRMFRLLRIRFLE